MPALDWLAHPQQAGRALRGGSDATTPAVTSGMHRSAPARQQRRQCVAEAAQHHLARTRRSCTDSPDR
eukprot:14990590-Alexandrium_andersonii.AAC.1